MRRRQLTRNADCDDILHWLDAHSVSVTQGLPAQLLNKRWEQAGRSTAQLGPALKLLFDQDWVAITPDLDPPHLRFSSEGFRKLIEAPLIEEPAAVAEAIAEAAPVASASAAERPVTVPAAPSTAAPAAATFRGPSELRLRNDILGIYRELKLKAGARLIGMTLSRYWQELGNRAGDLRDGIDVLVRDGFLQPRMVGIDKHWMLTEEGAHFMAGAQTPASLSRLAPPLDRVSPTPPADELRLLTSRVLVAELGPGESRLDYTLLRPAWMQRTRLDDNALLHGLDMLHKLSCVQLHEGRPLDIEITAAGRTLASQETPKLAKVLSLLNKALGG
ncbi:MULTISPECIES: hypothetical protein [Hydrocarboniphaga]|uniref:Uncharacterized protein n=1 Tax=Hydrocarboniphaga effusa AP103 TaxID=1172194 RepID=I7ZDM9_9GAMM|nr:MULTISPECIES: hypothetical protein [Hydrocarboniphaga]EIT69959.1 hypothetical protein WQQ_00960 [Hydrocarboniphaga effusa AP103]EIT70146.1 hypothetical protein WQQ_02830 [Hydrocarboniphaga effusa AP103]MDZ4078541.1 hypothetical protein [Hydrocarboniphaga sp.]